MLGKNGYGKSHLFGLIISLLYDDKKKIRDWVNSSQTDVSAALYLAGDIPGQKEEAAVQRSRHRGENEGDESRKGSGDEDDAHRGDRDNEGERGQRASRARRKGLRRKFVADLQLDHVGLSSRRVYDQPTPSPSIGILLVRPRPVKRGRSRRMRCAR